MQNYTNDKRIVLTLDAGGTNFAFGAIQGGKPIFDGVSKPSNAHELNNCLATLVEGFEEIKCRLNAEPVAISFAFPGPADYPNGIIGDLPNLPAFRGGVALGSFLESKFNIPVFINNDGNLFAYGEALAGMLPQINADLKNAGNIKQYQNLIGLTLGTGFGAGLVFNKQLLLGDNSIAAEVWLLSNRIRPKGNVEEIVSAKGLVAEYNKQASSSEPSFTPTDIYNIAKGAKQGNQQAALNTFELFGCGIGDAVANLITIFDGLVVIGGGITGAKEFYLPAMLAELNGSFTSISGRSTPRLVQKAFNYSDEQSRLEFLKPVSKKISVPGSSNKVYYDAIPRVAIAHSQMGASKAIQLGAYFFALNKLNNKTG